MFGGQLGEDSGFQGHLHPPPPNSTASYDGAHRLGQGFGDVAMGDCDFITASSVCVQGKAMITCNAMCSP